VAHHSQNNFSNANVAGPQKIENQPCCPAKVPVMSDVITTLPSIINVEIVKAATLKETVLLVKFVTCNLYGFF